MSESWEQRRASLLAMLGASTVEHPLHIYPEQDPFGHTPDDGCPCGPVLKKIEWPELTYWAKVHPALVPEEAYRLRYPEDDDG